MVMMRAGMNDEHVIYGYVALLNKRLGLHVPRMLSKTAQMILSRPAPHPLKQILHEAHLFDPHGDWPAELRRVHEREHVRPEGTTMTNSLAYTRGINPPLLSCNEVSPHLLADHSPQHLLPHLIPHLDAPSYQRYRAFVMLVCADTNILRDDVQRQPAATDDAPRAPPRPLCPC